MRGGWVEPKNLNSNVVSKMMLNKSPGKAYSKYLQTAGPNFLDWQL